VIANLTRPWHELPIVVIDTETTGVDPATDAVVEIAAVRFESGRIVAEWSSLVDPGIEIPASATAIHGITQSAVQGKPSLVECAPDLLRVSTGAVPCAYDAPFDRAFLHAAITGTDCLAFEPYALWIDPLVIVRRRDRFERGKGRHKLTEACKRHGVELTEAHRALGDARATGALLWRLHEREPIECSAAALILAIEAQRVRQDTEFARWKASQPEVRT